MLSQGDRSLLVDSTTCSNTSTDHKLVHTADVLISDSPPTFTSPSSIDAALTTADRLVLQNLFGDAAIHLSNPDGPGDDPASKERDQQTIDELSNLSNSEHPHFESRIFASWHNTDFPPWVRTNILLPYTAWARNVVRRPSDIAFLTYIIPLFLIGIPNMISLFVRFNWYQALLQWLLVTYLVGPYSIVMHNHIHGRGFMCKSWSYLDTLFPYIVGPMMGQTWNSFYYHHKHHHVEDNGPNDLSSTLRYQRDSGLDLAIYLGRFVFFIWLELPIYYARKGIPKFGLKFFAWEMASYAFIVFMARINFAAAMTTLVLPLIQWRVAIMANNWGQHAFIDEEEPDSNLRCSITLIDVVANRYGFNDGYHTNHHIIPARHWSEHPQAFIKTKQQLAEGRALTFQKVDFIKLTYLLLRKDYSYLAKCLIPMGEQVGQSNEELAAMLQRKTQRFSEPAIRRKFGQESQAVPLSNTSEGVTSSPRTG